MAKTIDTLVQDIQELFDNNSRIFDDVNVKAFADKLALKVSVRMNEERGKPTLRLSNLGWPDRKLWYYVNQPEKSEPLGPEVKLKFLYGDILEELMLFLAKEAGHTVTDEQLEVDLYGVKGHIDGKIDNVPVDVKSASSFSFDKFASGLSESEDSFGYLRQLDAYLHSLGASRGGFLAIDKTLGKLALDLHPRSDVNYEILIAKKIAMLVNPKPPPRCYSDVPDGKSGNRKLDIGCSYCSFKKTCWPSLRTFIYASGPRFLTQVERLPEVKELIE